MGERIAYEVRAYGLPGHYRWRIEIRSTADELPGLRPLIGDIYQPEYENGFCSQEAAERGAERFLERMAANPPRGSELV